jgi:hypothetical protein
MLLPALFIILNSFSVSACDEPTWQRYAPTDARFEVSMPADPTVSIKYVDTDGNFLPVNMVSAHPDFRDDFEVAWTDYSKTSKKPRATDHTFDMMRDALADSKNATILSERQVTMHGNRGRSMRMRTDDGQLVDVIFLVTRSRVYQVMAQTRSGDEPNADRQRFLGSFKLNSDD